MGFVAWVRALFGESEPEESRFVPSPLDRSVRIAHGGKADEIARELTEIREQAREFGDTFDDP